MLYRLRKRFESLLARTTPAEEPSATPDLIEVKVEVEARPEKLQPPNEGETLLLASREAHRRESRLILTERIHNRAAVLFNEVRTELLHDIHRDLEREVRTPSLPDLLQVTLDRAFTARLDASIDRYVENLLKTLEKEFPEHKEAGQPLLRRDHFVSELQLYRDSVLKKHLLDQVEVLALPTSAQAFPENRGNAEELKERIAQYWIGCRDALERFFRSVEMVLLHSAREGIRIESSVIRDRLRAAQYRNGYRLLDERFRVLHAEVAALDLLSEPEEKKRAALDRRVVDEIIVPLAYFIRERSEPEPREALRSRAELFFEIVDKLVAISDPFPQTAEAIKPVLRKSVEEARPLAYHDAPFLRPAIESLNPSAIHRTTALLKVFETLVQIEIDEWSLQAVEQVIRLNRSQFRLYELLHRGHRDLVRKLAPFDRIWDQDAELIADVIAQTEPPRELVEDLFLALGYLEWPEPLPEDARTLLRYVGVCALFPGELVTWPSLYLAEAPAATERARLARTLLERLRPSGVGSDERQKRLGAAPVPVDLNKALAGIGYLPEEKERLPRFREEIRAAVEKGDAPALALSLSHLRKLRESVDRERGALGARGMDADPYLVELWLTPESTLIGLVVFRGAGFGIAPIESLSRDPGTGSRQETEEKLRRQLQSQAIIYQTFWKLFSRRSLLSKEHRRGLPAFVKTLYEPTEPNRLLLLTRLRYAKELLALMEVFALQIAESDSKATAEATGVTQILTGLARKVDELIRAADKSREPAELLRLVKEYERALKYLNTVVVHSVNPWLQRQTSDLGTGFEFKAKEAEAAVRRHTSQQGLNWEEDVEGFEAHPIKGTFGCRALLKLVDGTSKAILLDYDRRRHEWQVRHMGPRLTDVVRDALTERGKSLPEDYDEKFEQHTFRLEEQSCRFLWVKRGVARIEATLVLDDDAQQENPWRVVYLRYNDEVLTDRLS